MNAALLSFVKQEDHLLLVLGCTMSHAGGKFAGASDLWRWSATLDGAAVDFASCCSDAGFDAACQCSS